MFKILPCFVNFSLFGPPYPLHPLFKHIIYILQGCPRFILPVLTFYLLTQYNPHRKNRLQNSMLLSSLTFFNFFHFPSHICNLLPGPCRYFLPRTYKIWLYFLKTHSSWKIVLNFSRKAIFRLFFQMENSSTDWPKFCIEGPKKCFRNISKTHLLFYYYFILWRSPAPLCKAVFLGQDRCPPPSNYLPPSPSLPSPSLPSPSPLPPPPPPSPPLPGD